MLRNSFLIILAFGLHGLAIVCHAADLTTQFSKLSAEFSSSDHLRSVDARQEWQQLCVKSRGSNRENVSRLMASHLANLKSASHRSEMHYLVRLIGVVGHASSVPTLRNYLAHEDDVLRDAALQNLTHIADEKATLALEDALREATSSREKVSLLNALAYRQGAGYLDLLSGYLKSGDVEICRAAANALAIGATTEGAEALLKAIDAELATETQSEHITVLARALLATADRQRSADSDFANKIFAKVQRLSVPSHLKSVAFLGLLRTSDDRFDMALKELLDGGRHADIVIGEVSEMDESVVTRLVSEQGKFSDAHRIAFFASLGARRFAPAQGTLQDVFQDRQVSSAVRIAALDAFGEVAGPDDVPTVMPFLSENGILSESAKKCLVSIRDPRANRLLQQAFAASKSKWMQSLMVDVLYARRDPFVADIAAGELTSKDMEKRRRARGILSRLGSPDHLAELIDAAGDLTVRERDQLSRTIVHICNRIPDRERQAAPLIALYENVSLNDRLTILSVCGRIGGGSAARFVRSIIDSGDADYQDAAVTALANWPNGMMVEPLRDIVRSERPEAQRIRALRGLARVVVLPTSPIGREAQLNVLREAFTYASRIDERRLILDRVKAIDRFAAVEFLRDYLDDEELKETACRSIVHVARIGTIREQHPEIESDLQRVMKVSQDRRTLERAKQYIDEMRLLNR